MENWFSGVSVTPSLLWVPVPLEMIVLLREGFPSREGSQEASRGACVCRQGADLQTLLETKHFKAVCRLGTQTKHLIRSARHLLRRKHSLSQRRKDAASMERSTWAVTPAPRECWFPILISYSIWVVFQDREVLCTLHPFSSRVSPYSPIVQYQNHDTDIVPCVCSPMSLYHTCRFPVATTTIKI